MENILEKIVNRDEFKDFEDFIYVISNLEDRFFLHNEIQLQFSDYCESKKKDEKFRTKSTIFKLVNRLTELIVLDDAIVMVYRHDIAKYKFYKLAISADYLVEIEASLYLDYKDLYAQGFIGDGKSDPLEINFIPFYDFSPDMMDSRKIGDGMRFLNKHLSSSLFQYPEKYRQKLFEFIKLHKLNEKPLLVNEEVLSDFSTFYDELKHTIKMLSDYEPELEYREIRKELRSLGFEQGWGKNVKLIKETMQILLDLLHEPDDTLLEKFISRIPMISRIAVVSIHGWFGQEDVLGRPDTGGQVTYILDQVRYLEKYLTKMFDNAGLEIEPKIIVITRLIPEAEDTTCSQRTEKILPTNNCWILRIPFYDDKEQVVKEWISRFKIWPYLDKFARDAERELVSEFHDPPDLIIGNYSDGNLVATLLSDKLGVIQCNIAHALEKTKYTSSDMYWQEVEEEYNFSIQFTADMLSMNKSDFIITSSYQEIAGSDTDIGQYESYQFFTMPGLYHVTGGVNLFHPKFNVVPPGVDEHLYFPYYESDNRVQSRKEYWENRLFNDDIDDVSGTLEDPEKPPIFTMARLDWVKNISGLVEAFGKSKILKEKCNLIFAGGTYPFDSSDDKEEQDEIRKIVKLIDDYKLEGKVRWIPKIKKRDTGEVYRIIADKKGIFVQPALFEAFGLTVLESMLCGLPVFATKFGGPSEILDHGKDGYLINTSCPDMMAEVIEKFIEDSEEDFNLWREISEAGIDKVKKIYTWHNYSKKLITLTNIYGFWRYSVAQKQMAKLDRYCDLLYHLFIRARAEKLF